MKEETFTFNSIDNTEIHCIKWLPGNRKKIRAIVQIVHGMAEHSERYRRFAKALIKAGFGVYANDHRGHGKTAGNFENLGYFADNSGWELVVGDMKRLTDIIETDHQGLPVFLFGHSMGSFLSRDYFFTCPEKISGVILSGTACNPGLMGYIGIAISKLESLIRGRLAQSPLLDKLSFGSFNNAFKPNRTPFDWLSRDNAEVDKYINDPLCGTIFTTGFFNDLLKGIKKINKSSNISMVPKALPVYIYSGEKDPVGDNTKGVQKVFDQYKKTGIVDLSLKFYKECRHETLNELNRDEVFKDVIEWIEKHITD